MPKLDRHNPSVIYLCAREELPERSTGDDDPMPLMVGDAGSEAGPWGKHAEDVRARREELGLSQIELGIIGGFSRGTVKTAEAGKPLTGRTLPSLHYALGWQPRLPFEIENGVPARPVVSAEAMRAIVSVLLSVVHEETPGRDESELARLRVDLNTLVASRSQPQPRQPFVPHLYRRLRDRLTDGQLMDLERELEFAHLEPPYTHKGEASHPQVFDADTIAKIIEVVEAKRGGLAVPELAPPELQAVYTSRLPVEVQRAIIRHAMRRREEVEASLLAEIHGVIDIARQAGTTTPSR